MSEHSVYSSEQAVPVLATPVLATPVLAAPQVAPSRDRLVRKIAVGPAPARLDRSGFWSVNKVFPAPDADWTFRSIRRDEAAASPRAGALTDLRSDRIHLKSLDSLRPKGEATRRDAGSSMSDPRLMRPQTRIASGARRMTAFDLYTSHFGLTERPFSLVPDPDFLFWSTPHQHAFAMMEYGILTRAPITLITGEIGIGKTTLVHELIKTIGNEVRIGLISNTHGSPGEMLRWVMLALGQPTDATADYPELLSAFQSHVIAEYAKGNRIVLIFDEAQTLNRDTLEELRMLTNINSGKDELLQLVLVGQPELRDIVQQPDMHQLRQRVAASFHLSAMDAATVRDYISHRLLVAGATSALFSQAAVDLIHAASGGIPRRVNQLCDLAMVYAYTAGQKSIMRMTVQQVLEDGTYFDVMPRDEALFAAQ
jgi:general secretion pathway protein A